MAVDREIGRTHLMDATPLTAGQEVSAWAAQLHAAHEDIQQTSLRLQHLAIGGTAVGTGLNAPAHWGDHMATELQNLTQVDFNSAQNKFAALSSHDAVVTVSGSLSALAAALTKIGNDVRLLSSGPRCGLGELMLPENEPGSSIMPGKVNLRRRRPY
jgi:fumarate hydratase class II